MHSTLISIHATFHDPVAILAIYGGSAALVFRLLGLPRPIWMDGPPINEVNLALARSGSIDAEDDVR